MSLSNPFDSLERTPTHHFKLYFFSTAMHVIDQAAQTAGSFDALFEQFPFLAGYYDELSALGVREDDLSGSAFGQWLDEWEKTASCHLPIAALRASSHLPHEALLLLFCVGLIEEDGRFGLLFEAMQTASGVQRPTLGLLNAWWREHDDWTETRMTVRRFLAMGLVQVVNPDAPRMNWALQCPSLLWDALRGETPTHLAGWAHFRPSAQLLGIDELILDEETRQQLETIPALLAQGEISSVVVRGLQQNGRRTLLGAVARSLGRNVLEIVGVNGAGSGANNDERWQLAGVLATLLHALPVVTLDLAPGETADLPLFEGGNGALGVVMGKQGGLRGAAVERAVTIALEMPSVTARQRFWERALRAAGSSRAGKAEVDGNGLLVELAQRFRMTGGNIWRVARLAHSYAALAGRTSLALADVQQASRALNRQALETLTTRVAPLAETHTGDSHRDAWRHLAVDAQILGELHDLEARCRHRERLYSAAGATLSAQLNVGVRALFAGPSGAGKTLAARVLANALNKDLYRIDLASVVNKYIGETEKNLAQIFARAEELDVVLLLDEGDALLTQRTSVSNANDRYANLETNYLLQRLESFEGILIVTTNAAERIDGAFARRMDVLVEFHTPDVAERLSIWQLHLPEKSAVERRLLDEVAGRCVMSGGQIRNAALHATLLAMNNGGVVTSDYLEAAVQREYRKIGAVCPLRRLRHE